MSAVDVTDHSGRFETRSEIARPVPIMLCCAALCVQLSSQRRRTAVSVEAHAPRAVPQSLPTAAAHARRQPPPRGLELMAGHARA